MAHCQMWWYIWIVWVQARCQRQRGAMLSGSCSWFQASYTPQHRGFVCRRSLTASSDQLQSCCLSKTVGTSQANKVHGFCPPPPQKRGENSARRRQHHNILSNLQQKKLIQQVSSHISPPRLDSFLWTNLMFTSMPLEGLACQWGRQHA